MPSDSTAEHGLCFQIKDITESRSDLAMRREVKYAIPGSDVIKLRRLLEVNARAVSHNQRISKVRSIYFDDCALSSYMANVNGLNIRNKLRLRWYDNLLPALRFYLEIKWKQNRVSGKHRMEVISNQPLGELSYAQIRRELLRVTPAKYLPFLERYDEPTVLVEYSREHYVSLDGVARFTIDYDLQFYDQLARRSINTRFPQAMPGLMLIEGKVPPGQENMLQKLLFPFSARATRCSKYGYGCQTLNLASSKTQ